MADAGTPATGTQPEGATPEGTQPEGTAQPEGTLGPEGQKALDAFKERARTAEKQTKELQERLDKLEEANKTETEKALDRARKEARKEAESDFEKERRSDRLQVAVAAHARDLADVDDVVLNIQRGSTEELFDAEGLVKRDALKDRLDRLLTDKPHLKATGTRPQGSANGGEGEGGDGGGSFNDLARSMAGYRT